MKVNESLKMPEWLLKGSESPDRKERIIVTLVSLFVTGLVMFFFVGLNAGWHLVDDHELFAHKILLDQGHSVWEVTKLNIGFDVDLGRWRPLYRLFRVLEALFIVDHLRIFYLWEFIRVFLTFLLLYGIARELKAGILLSFVFPLTVLFGYQAAAWWKLGPQEMFSMLLFTAGIRLLLRYVRTEKKLFAGIAVFLFLLMSLYKEAFILCIPFAMLFVLYADTADTERLSFRILWENIRKRLLLYILMALIVIVNLYIIVFKISTRNMGAKGDSWLEPWYESVTHDLKWYALFGTVLFLLVLTYGKECRKLFRELVLCLSLILPQYLLYGKRAIEERYLLPLSVGFGLMFIIFVPLKLGLKGIRGYLFAGTVFLLLAAHMRVTLREGEYYRFRGQSVTNMLSFVRKASNENPDIRVLSCLYPNMEGDWTIADLNRVDGLMNVYYYTEDDGGKIELVKDPEAEFVPLSEESIPGDLADMDIIVKYNELDRHWCYNPTFDRSDFDKVKCGTLDLYIRKGSGISMPDIKIRKTLFHFDYVTTVDPEAWENG